MRRTHWVGDRGGTLATMERGEPPVAPSPETIALWLAIVDTAHVARSMATAEAPPTIDSVSWYVDGRAMDPDDYIPYGRTIHADIIGTNCAEARIVVPGGREPIRARALHVVEPVETFSLSFPATQTGLATVYGVNALGQRSPVDASTQANLEVRVIPPVSGDLFTLPPLPDWSVNDAALEQLAATWSRYREYSLDVDSAELSREQRLVSDTLHAMAAGTDPSTNLWAARLQDIVKGYPRTIPIPPVALTSPWARAMPRSRSRRRADSEEAPS